MSIFAIADLHLSFSTDKPMDVFGPSWADHAARLEENWRAKIKDEDTVLVPGDISWGISLREALADLEFIESLPGTKILSKGNHDLWWGTTKKVEDFMTEHGLRSMKILKNNGFVIEGSLIAGSRGWLLPENPESKQEDEKIYQREVGRLERSLQDSIIMFNQNGADGRKTVTEENTGRDPENPEDGKKPARRIAMLHYPPIYDPERSNGFTHALEKYGVDLCLYGHLHGRAHTRAYNGVRNGVEYRLVAGDYLRFDPYLVQK
ncbi:MAG: metallophosphoesterase [Clostridiales bacterium]|nr:metallophosphoesterase [Clostridiales bacterium]